MQNLMYTIFNAYHTQGLIKNQASTYVAQYSFYVVMFFKKLYIGKQDFYLFLSFREAGRLLKTSNKECICCLFCTIFSCCCLVCLYWDQVYQENYDNLSISFQSQILFCISIFMLELMILFRYYKGEKKFFDFVTPNKIMRGK